MVPLCVYVRLAVGQSSRYLSLALAGVCMGIVVDLHHPGNLVVSLHMCERG